MSTLLWCVFAAAAEVHAICVPTAEKKEQKRERQRERERERERQREKKVKSLKREKPKDRGRESLLEEEAPNWTEGLHSQMMY